MLDAICKGDNVIEIMVGTKREGRKEGERGWWYQGKRNSRDRGGEGKVPPEKGKKG